MEKRHYFLIVALISATIFVIPSVYSVFAGQHWFYDPGVSRCLKCHPDIQQEIDSSNHHQSFNCENCHVVNTTSNSTHGNVIIPRCLDCHAYPPRTVTDPNNNTYVAGVATVFGENVNSYEVHNPLVMGASSTLLMKGEDEACIFCHSSFGTSITYTRPESIEWDVVNVSGSWTIENLSIGIDKNITVEKSSDGKPHNITALSDIDCISCHGDINSAVLAGGHSSNISIHNYINYMDMNSYCRSCHKPVTQNGAGVSPYSAAPFNSPVHSAIGITCYDCHGKTGSLFVNINGIMATPLFNPAVMGGIQTSISQQPTFVQSYICLACHNTGNPVPNPSLHFKLYTEPDVRVYVNGTQQFP